MNIIRGFGILFVLFVVSACNDSTEKKAPSTQPITQKDEVPLATKIDTVASLVDSNYVPIWGNRLEIEGDFDGDGIKEILREKFISLKSGKEINKFYEAEYEITVDLTYAKDPYAYLLCSNPKIDTLMIGSGQVFGLMYLKNEGDLNEDGIDDISYIRDNADWSNLNSCHIASYINNKWQDIFTFPINEMQLYVNIDSNNTTGAINLIKKIGGKKIKYIGLDKEYGFDTLVGTLK